MHIFPLFQTRAVSNVSANITDLFFGDTQVHLDGVQDSHPIGGKVSSRGLLAVHVEKDGQEVLGEAAHFSLFFLYRHRSDKNKSGATFKQCDLRRCSL